MTYIHLTGDIRIKKDKECIVILEWDKMGNISKVKVDGKEREFIENRELYIKGGESNVPRYCRNRGIHRL